MPVRKVVNRDVEYSYDIDVTERWEKMGEGWYSRSAPWGRIRITSSKLADGVTLEQNAARVRDNLERYWWPTRALFEITSFQEKRIDGLDFYAIAYRVQKSPESCVVDIAALVTVSNAVPGPQRGFQVDIWMCEYQVPNYGSDRAHIQQSFRVTTQPAAYYRQFLTVKGVNIKATSKVDPNALLVAGDIVDAMLSGREDIADCMADTVAEVAVIPKDESITTVPEFANLRGLETFDGRDWESVRGSGAVKGRTVMATSEESLLGLKENGYPYIALIMVHEFAHGIRNLCFTEEDHAEWNGFYDAGLQKNIFPGEYLMSNEEEFFAVFSTAYFEVTDELGNQTNRNLVESDFPKIFEFLDDIYDDSTLPPEAKQRTPGW